ncbi:hypothetical protein [Leifsonia sp. Root112D2]|uniref:hypothetical protein n=1 Tax=Leifsonia sp. Root112D2 TaxID=1736426 RepID=UPI0012F7C760|nr:hypothetical protein [Leifsonia sp. Root112D2]
MKTQDRVAGIDDVHRVSVRVVNAKDEVESMNLDVNRIGPGYYKIQHNHVVIGYIQRAGHLFVALGGTRSDRAEEWGQYLIWDHAAAKLLRQSSLTNSNQ